MPRREGLAKMEAESRNARTVLWIAILAKGCSPPWISAAEADGEVMKHNKEDTTQKSATNPR